MEFDINNSVVKLCADGMLLEGQGKANEALHLFTQAWAIATTDFEKFTAAHYVARHQDSVEEKLTWDKLALAHALKMENDDIGNVLPSLYLNIGKCYEDLNEPGLAQRNYRAGLTYVQSDSDDGYEKMIRAGLEAGLARIAATVDNK